MMRPVPGVTICSPTDPSSNEHALSDLTERLFNGCDLDYTLDLRRTLETNDSLAELPTQCDFRQRSETVANNNKA